MSLKADEPVAARITAVAAALFREKGFAATSTRALSERLGIQNSSLYHHIRSKDDLLYSISMEAVRHMDETLDAVLADDTYALAPASERLRRVITAHLTAALGDRDMHATALFEMRALPPERRDEVVAARAGYELRLREILVQAQGSGDVVADASAQYLTLALLNLLNWSIFWYRPDGDLTIVELAEILSNVYLTGVLKSD
jgi:AcrR family transcriptional regulator